MYRLIMIQLMLLLAITGTTYAGIYPELNLGSVYGRPGDTVTIPVTLVNNGSVGIVSVAMDIGYNASLLESPKAVIGIAGSSAGKLAFFSLPGGGGILRLGVLNPDPSTNLTPIGNGVVATVSFTIKAGATLGPVHLSNNPTATDSTAQDIPVTGTAGAITISDIIPGDVNIDNKVDVFDALLALQYSVGLIAHTPENQSKFQVADVAPLDANTGIPQGDSKIDVFDALAILRHAVGLDHW